jgi:hypothetical protein
MRPLIPGESQDRQDEEYKGGFGKKRELENLFFRFWMVSQQHDRTACNKEQVAK